MSGLLNRVPLRMSILGALGLLATLTQASQVPPINLEELTAHAATIFTGSVVETSSAVDPTVGREVTVVVFQVDRALKGDVGSTTTVRMIGGSGREAFAGAPSFRPGEEVVLFLYGKSKLGLSSPVGLGQGRFTVLSGKQGRRIAINDFGNDHLLSGLTADAETRLGPTLGEWRGRRDLEPEPLLEMVETLLLMGPPAQAAGVSP